MRRFRDRLQDILDAIKQIEADQAKWSRSQIR